MKNFRTTYYTFNQFKEKEFTSGNDGKVATQLMRMYRTICEYERPVILELGTGKGQATTVFLKACEEKNGKLVSIDINDCSDVSDHGSWTFVQSDSRAKDFIIENAPHLKDGIDLLYVDSLHEKEQVESELMTWFPYMKEKSHIFFDDVDANPCRKGNRKDDFGKERAWNEIYEYVQSFFYTNENELYLDIMYGTTGLAHLYKISPLGSTPQKAVPIIHRKDNLYNNFLHLIKTYSFKVKRKLLS